MPEWSLLLQNQLVLLWGRDCETWWWAGAREREKVENPGHGSSPNTPCYCPALVLYAWWEKKGLNGHPCTWKLDLFPHHTLQRLGLLTRVMLTIAFSQNSPEPRQHRGAELFHTCSGREERTKKERKDWCPCLKGWSGAWAVGSACVAKRSVPTPALAQCLVQHGHSTNSGAPLSLWFKENGSHYHKPFLPASLSSRHRQALSKLQQPEKSWARGVNGCDCNAVNLIGLSILDICKVPFKC